jgi:hypothetical protein
LCGGARLAKQADVRRLVVVALLLVPAVASAEDPSRVYGAGSLVLAGFAGKGGPGFDLTAGVRYRALWIHGAFTAISMDPSEAGGHLYEPHLGIEWRTYDNPTAAVFWGFDAGLADGSAPIEDETDPLVVRGAFAMARAGLEIGGVHARLRLAIEVLGGYARVSDPTESPMTQRGFQPGMNIDVGVTVR